MSSLVLFPIQFNSERKTTRNANKSRIEKSIIIIMMIIIIIITIIANTLNVLSESEAFRTDWYGKWNKHVL